MNNFLLNVYSCLRSLRDEHGQDMIEYVLVAALIALAATAGMNSMAANINTALTNIGTKLTTYTS
jgi:pilus assembly protein Flp/PilA